jgi:hypothetical protein
MGGDIKRKLARLPRGKPALRYLKCAWLTCSCSSRGLRRTQLRSRHRPRTENHAIESPQREWPKPFVRTIKHDYVRVSPCPDAQTLMHQLSAWINP